MEIKTVTEEVKSLNYLIVAYDISKHKHNYYTSFYSGLEKRESEGVILNKTNALQKHFEELHALAKNEGFHGVRVVCEPTGGYEKRLLRKARENGFFTQYVNGEATNKAKVIESNDSGKNDVKDARVIHMLASMNRTLSCEERDDEYGQLKFYNAKYESLSTEGARKKCKISHLIEELFPDSRLKPRQIYSKIVGCVITEYGLNPYEINKLNLGDLLDRIEEPYGRMVGGSSLEILIHLLEDAQVGKMNILPSWKVKSLVDELKDTYQEWKAIDAKKANYKKLMEEAVHKTDEWDKVKETPVKAFLFSRVLAESGPWKAYKGIRQLLRFAGLNLRERQSGTYKGELKLSKKGNILMRKALGQMVYCLLIGKGSLYEEYYKEKKAKKGGLYGITCTMRKTLKMLLGVYKSQASYNVERVFQQNVELEKIPA